MLLIKQEMPQRSGRSDSAFESVKGQILEALRLDPGLGISKLSEAISEDKTLVQSTVKVMMQNGELKSKGQKKGTVYFTGDTDLRTVGRDL